MRARTLTISDIKATHLARRGELWMLGVIFGYVTSYLFDKMAVVNIDPLIGPLFRRLPSLLLGIVLLFAQGMTDQLKPSSPRFVGKPTLMVFALAGAMTTAGMFAYYYALLFGGVVITVPVSQTLVLWGTIVGWVYLKERFSRKVAFGIIAVCAGLALLAICTT